MHLDQAVAPVEPVLGTMASADRDTLVRHRHVHQIPLDSEGTVRPERIETEVFARPTNTCARAESSRGAAPSRPP
ncbi:hypothetical protein ACIQWZ_39260 [Streptomyces sp. NPDC098077]|uniref:hypothetical protein n=1 Tax=Streptomyces sp. NPDC098077 TaxID=3366093 RepID=UPI00382575BA